MKTSPSKSALFSTTDSPIPGPYRQPDLLTSRVTGSQELSFVRPPFGPAQGLRVF